MTLELLLQIFAGLYIAELGLYSFGAMKARTGSRRTVVNSGFPKISVVIAAKDEEQNLPSCLASVAKLDYPADKLEVIVVNDQSIDCTPSVIDDFSRDHPFVKRIDAVEQANIRGKANALAQGIDAASGEFIFLTDADCSVPVEWIKDSLKYFDKDTGIIGGVTLISNIDKRVYGIQAVDWDFLLSVGSGAATLGKPVACLGNNLVFRKRAYEDVGGYKKIRFSVTEDFALFNAIASSKWKFKYPMDAKTLVETKPVETIGQVFSQRRRWATGGKDSSIYGFITLGAGFIFHWLILLSPIWSFQDFVTFLAVKVIIDSAFVVPTMVFYGRIAHLKFILYFEIYYLVYVAILPFSVFVGKSVRWKGREYN